MRNYAVSTLSLILALVACQRRDPHAGSTQGPASGGPVVIAPGGGLGGTRVSAGGGDVWPPQGANCGRLVACCQQASSTQSDVALFCQMSVATPPVDCLRALGEVRQYLTERQVATPPACLGAAPP